SPEEGQHDAAVAAVKAWPVGARVNRWAERRPALTASARDVVSEGRSGRGNGPRRTRKLRASGLWYEGDLGRLVLPWRATRDDRVGEDEQLSGAGNECAL